MAAIYYQFWGNHPIFQTVLVLQSHAGVMFQYYHTIYRYQGHVGTPERLPVFIPYFNFVAPCHSVQSPGEVILHIAVYSLHIAYDCFTSFLPKLSILSEHLKNYFKIYTINTMITAITKQQWKQYRQQLVRWGFRYLRLGCEVQDNRVPPYFLNCLQPERKQTLKAKAESALIICLPNECFNEILSEKYMPKKTWHPYSYFKIKLVVRLLPLAALYQSDGKQHFNLTVYPWSISSKRIWK